MAAYRVGVFVLVPGLGLAVAISGCRRSPHEQQPVVAIVPSADLAPATVVEGGAVAVTYRWRTGADFTPLARDYHVFAHLVDEEGATLVGDDHDPVPGTSTWEPSREYAYTRTLFVPRFYRLHLRVRVGLFLEDQRLALQGTHVGRQEYEVGAFSVVTRSPENEPVRFGDEWAPPHSDAGDPLRPVRWMLGSTGTVLLRSPREDSLLLLEATVAPTRVGNWPVVDMSLGPATWSLPLRVREVVVLKLRVPGTAWGDEEWTPLRLTLGSETSVSAREPFGAGEGLGLRGIGVLPMAAAPAELAAGAVEPKEARGAQ
jgi:hypothetical protein